MDADVSHFTMVGFELNLKDAAAMGVALDPYMQSCKQAPLGGRKRICTIRDPSGAEMWIGLEEGKDGVLVLQSVNPAFAGEGRANVEITGDASDPAWRPYEIAVTARFAGDAVPLVFDLADPRQAALATRGRKLAASLAAFSFDAEIFKDEQSYYAAQKAGEARVIFAADHFIPSGMFAAESGTAAERPESRALLAGTVLKSELRGNEAGRGRFWWALVRTYGGVTIDVVLDPATVKRDPVPGSVVSGSFWLTGRVLPGK